MLRLETRGGVRLCDGVTRRELLRVGAVGLGGLSLPGLLRAGSTAAGAPKAGRGFGRAKSVIVFATNGGTGQMDSFDPKPDAPLEVRGPYKGAPTNVPGVRINEDLPRLAKLADKYALLRAVNHNVTIHPSAIYLTLCGDHLPRAVTPESATGSRDDRPHFGSVLTKVRPGKRDLPGFVLLPAAMGPNGPDWPGQFAGFLGAAHDPYRLNSDPNLKSYSPGALAADPELPAVRVGGRRELLGQLARQADYLEKQEAVRALDPHYAKAFDLIASPAAQKAFDLSAESDATRDRYGRHYAGQSLLLARRLVEAGVRLVQVNWMRSNIGGRGGPGFDTHRNCFELIKKNLYPPTDAAFSALLQDLGGRGLLDETLVVFCNEFGRTPKLNAQGGRDHWPWCYSVLLAGGAIKGGVAYGASDKIGAYPAADPVGPKDVLATLYHCLGVDPETTMYDHLRRPHKLVEGRPIQGIL